MNDTVRYRRRPEPTVRVVEAFLDPRDRTVRRDVPVVSRPWAVLRAAAAREQVDGGAVLELLAA